MSRKILIIDDDHVVLAMTKDFLSDTGYNVVAVECPVYSNHMIYSKTPPDLIIMDVMMPLMSGVKKAKILKSREKSREIPIVLISSKNEDELSALTVEAQADGYLPKPFSKDRLVEKVLQFVAA